MELAFTVIALEYNPTGDSVDIHAGATVTGPVTFTFNVSKAKAKKFFVGLVLKVVISEVTP